MSSVGEVSISLPGRDASLTFTVPWPHDGVFLLRSDRTWEVDRWRWHPRLVLPPGVHFLRYFVRQGLRVIAVADRAHRKKCEVRSQRSRSRPSDEPGAARAKSEKKPRAAPVFLPPAARTALDRFGITQGPLPAVVDWRGVERALTAWCEANVAKDDQLVDARDIRNYRLFTYNLHLQQAVLRGVAQLIWTIPDAMAAINGEQPIVRRPAKVWDDLVKAASDKRWIEVQPLVDEGLLVRFEPLNGIDAISSLTAFQRYDAPSSEVERMAAWRRQNHASFEGLVCPVESPETKKVGITLHLAQGCRVTAHGELHVAEGADQRAGDQGLGWAASLVPFAQHNDGVRCMMGAKNLKQAVSVRGAEPPALLTGGESAIPDRLLRPLREAGILSAEESTAEPGADLLVAYMPWYGWNADDAIVAHDRLRDVLAWQDISEHSEFVRPGVDLCDPPGDGIWAPLHRFVFDGGLRRPRGRVGRDDAVAWLRDSATGRVHEVLSGAKPGATLEAIDFRPGRGRGFGGHIRWRLRQDLPLGVGDKLMGRHGNKGVVSVLLPESQLPRLPDHDALQPSLRGRTVDLILNPNGVVSRMNLGQLIETHSGLLGRLQAGIDLSGLAAPFAFDRQKQAWLISEFQRVEKATDGVIDRYGRVSLVLPPRSEGDAPRTARAVAGFQYFVRLKHIPVEKANVRRGGACYSYNLTTGQAVRGRRHRGGQRLGEMEVWALAAHRASANLGEVLGPRSDPTWSSDAGPMSVSPTFYAVRDHLRAIGIALESENGTMKLRWLTSGDVAKVGREITSDATWQIATEGDYVCRRCDYRVAHLVGTREAQRTEQRQVCVADAIRDHLLDRRSGLAIGVKDVRDETGVTLVCRSHSGRSKEVTLDLSWKKRSVTARFVLGRTKFAAYQQVDGVADPTDATLLRTMRLTCPEHATSFLDLEQGRSVLWPEPGGVCDPGLVGDADLTSAASVPPGFIRLPFPVQNPLSRALPRGAERLPDVECLPVIPMRHRNAIAPSNMAKQQPAVDSLTRIYADLVGLCSEYRNHLAVESELGEGDGDKQRETWERRKKWLVRSIRELVAAVYQHVVGDAVVGSRHRRQRGVAADGRLFGKLGLLRYDGLGRRVDKSGRLVIVPDPTLRLEECRLPHLFLLELLLEELLADEGERAELQAVLAQALREPQDRPSAHGAGQRDRDGPAADSRRELPLPSLIQPETWREALASETALAARLVEDTKGTVSRHVESDGEARVLLNRQPTLHRYNLLAFRPRPPESASDAPVLRLSPLACKPFNADFDGDEMAIHAPLGSGALGELHAMTFGSSMNRISLADSSPVIGFSQELALGHFLLTALEGREAQAASIAQKVAVPGCATCAELALKPPSPGRDHPLLKHMLVQHGNEATQRIKLWADIAWEAATGSGTTFGWLEVMEHAGRIELPTCPPVQVNGELGERTIEILDAALRDGHAAPAFGLAALVLSGARGSAKQVRQLIGPRGWLVPGDVDDVPAAAFLIRSSLSAGMDWSDFFTASFNARSSIVDKKLLVAQAGALTRRLVLACWPWHIGRSDCGTSGTRSVVTCADAASERVVCGVCYGVVEALGGLPEAGFPVGIVAAQSIGERGTQLSMQSFHTGERAITPRTVSDLLERRGVWKKSSVYDSPEGFHEFRGWVRQHVPAYKRLDERHLAMVWLAIHASPGRSLKSAWYAGAGPVALLAGSDQLQDLIAAIGADDQLSHPVVKVIRGVV